MKRLLLISSSRTHGTSFLEHCRDAVADHLTGIETLTFIPYALANRDAYARLCRQAIEPLGVRVQSLHEASDPLAALSEAEAVFTGGGNTFRLLKALYDADLVGPLRTRILAGMPYMGSSAGTNLACPTIRTTNDMPIVEPPSFTALGVVPFQINPHFLDADPKSTHKGETREQRLAEYLEENTTPVVGLREGCWMTVNDDEYRIEGLAGAVLFQTDKKPISLETGTCLNDVMATT